MDKGVKNKHTFPSSDGGGGGLTPACVEESHTPFWSEVCVPLRKRNIRSFVIQLGNKHCKTYSNCPNIWFICGGSKRDLFQEG